MPIGAGGTDAVGVTREDDGQALAPLVVFEKKLAAFMQAGLFGGSQLVFIDANEPAKDWGEPLVFFLVDPTVNLHLPIGADAVGERRKEDDVLVCGEINAAGRE